MYKKNEDRYCPIVRKKIAEIICADVAHVAENFQPERFAPLEFRKIPQYKKICQSCKHNLFYDSVN